MKQGKTRKRLCALFVTALLLCIAGALSAGGAELDGRYARTFGPGDFKMNRDAVKHEVPEASGYRIIPRLADSVVWSHFQIPAEERSHTEWRVTATVRASDGPGAGVALWSAENGYALCLFPDGSGRMQYFEGKKAVWTTEFQVDNFQYPADVTIWRDANGSHIGVLNGIVVASRLLPVDLKNPRLEKITAVSFVTHSTKGRAGSPAFYEKLDVEGWGHRASLTLETN